MQLVNIWDLINFHQNILNEFIFTSLRKTLLKFIATNIDTKFITIERRYAQPICIKCFVTPFCKYAFRKL